MARRLVRPSRAACQRNIRGSAALGLGLLRPDEPAGGPRLSSAKTAAAGVGFSRSSRRARCSRRSRASSRSMDGVVRAWHGSPRAPPCARRHQSRMVDVFTPRSLPTCAQVSPSSLTRRTASCLHPRVCRRLYRALGVSWDASDPVVCDPGAGSGVSPGTTRAPAHRSVAAPVRRAAPRPVWERRSQGSRAADRVVARAWTQSGGFR